MAGDPFVEFARHMEEALGALGRVTEQMAELAKTAVGEVRTAAAHPTRMAGPVRRGAEEALDLGTAWIDPIRRLSEEQHRFADQMATWAERHRQFAAEVASWAETQAAFAEHLASWADPLLTYSEQLADAMKGLIRAAIPAPESESGPR